MSACLLPLEPQYYDVGPGQGNWQMLICNLTTRDRSIDQRNMRPRQAAISEEIQLYSENEIEPADDEANSAPT
ncbi:hypothetical protein PHISCL_01520 [Aspergillus sclerotialis]|uniref:Uncharacterized protein n=1 Tax=Aspergillus sclerotialis TaxID=2070753 RepID=A0A3A2ZTY5_9EURO|nr:hypothetical protein PHISCL_01520 [Aspergillus sclerotialis]